MILVNETTLPAELFRTMLTEDCMVGTIVAKATYVWTDEGELRLATEQRPVEGRPFTFEGVDFRPDGGYGKVGTDILAVATAYSGPDKPARSLMATIGCGNLECSVAVFGDRVWRRRAFGQLAATDPQPFASMPIRLDRAYGGATSVRGREVPCLANPVGRGFLLDPELAEGTPLPNIEDPDDLIAGPLDDPDPASFCPLPCGPGWGEEVLAEVEEDGAGLTLEIYNVAPPQHRLPGYLPRAPLWLRNLSPTPLRPAALPSEQIIAQVDIGAARHEFLGEVDSLLVLPEHRQVVLTHRVVFRYAYERKAHRVVRLRTRGLYERPPMHEGATP